MILSMKKLPRLRRYSQKSFDYLRLEMKIKLLRQHRTKIACGLRSQIFRQAEAAPRIVQIECRQAVSVGQPLCHFVTPPPSGGDYLSSEICARWRKRCKQGVRKAVRRSLCGVALSQKMDLRSLLPTNCYAALPRTKPIFSLNVCTGL